MVDLRKQFSKIYDQNIDKIYRFIFFKVNSQEIAQDLTSETFSRTWKKFQQADLTIKNPRAFLYQTARNLVVDYYREKGKAQIISPETVPVIDPAQNLEEKIILKSDLETVKTALANLKEEYQNVIIWHYLDDLPIVEVAKLLDKTEGTTRVLLHRALKALKEKVNSA